MLRRWVGSTLVTTLVSACNAPAPHTDGNAAGAGAVTVSSAAPRPTAAPLSASDCGKIPCRIFPDAAAAFSTVLYPLPVVLAIGESHAQQGAGSVESTTRRFMRELLPQLAGRATDLVVELMLPNPKCAPAANEARQEQKVVTEHQAKTDQSDYVELGTRAKALGIAPHALEPTCDDLASIAKAGPDVVTVSLDVVTRLMQETVSKLVAAHAAAKDTRAVVAYGGLMHNDVEPRAETAQWSFGPALRAQTANHYTELDLVSPEQIKDTPTWNALPWVPGFDRDAHVGRTVLLSASAGSYVLVFSRATAMPVVPTASPR